MNEMSRIEGNHAQLDVDAPRRRARLALMLSLPVLIVAAVSYWWLTSGKTVSTDNAVIEAPVVSVAPEVSGKIVEVAVTENKIVKAVRLVLLDKSDRPLVAGSSVHVTVRVAD